MTTMICHQHNDINFFCHNMKGDIVTYTTSNMNFGTVKTLVIFYVCCDIVTW